jgi:hypothetical protein
MTENEYLLLKFPPPCRKCYGKTVKQMVGCEHVGELSEKNAYDPDLPCYRAGNLGVKILEGSLALPKKPDRPRKPLALGVMQGSDIRQSNR